MRWFIAALVSVAWAIGSCHAQVVFDANASVATYNGTSASSISNANLTVGSGANRVLVAQVAFDISAGQSVSSCAWDPSGTNQSLSFIAGATSGADRTEIWGLVAPTSGNKTLTCNFSANVTHQELNVSSFIGADQTGGSTTFHNTNTATGTTAAPTITITSATGEIAIASLLASWASGNLVSSQTQLYMDNTIFGGGAAYGAGAASVTLSWSGGTGYTLWAQAGASIKAAAASSAKQNSSMPALGAGH